MLVETKKNPKLLAFPSMLPFVNFPQGMCNVIGFLGVQIELIRVLILGLLGVQNLVAGYSKEVYMNYNYNFALPSHVVRCVFNELVFLPSLNVKGKTSTYD